MAWELSVEGNYFKVEENISPFRFIEYPVKDVSIRKIDNSGDNFGFFYLTQQIELLEAVNIGDLVAKNGTDFVDLATFITWKDTATGLNPSAVTNVTVDAIESDPIFTASEANNFVIGDKAKLDAINNTWHNYSLNTKYNDLTQRIPTGKVLVGVIYGVTVYRYITDDKTGLYPNEDAFYSGFDGTTLTGLITTRG